MIDRYILKDTLNATEERMLLEHECFSSSKTNNLWEFAN